MGFQESRRSASLLRVRLPARGRRESMPTQTHRPRLQASMLERLVRVRLLRRLHDEELHETELRQKPRLVSCIAQSLSHESAPPVALEYGDGLWRSAPFHERSRSYSPQVPRRLY